MEGLRLEQLDLSWVTTLSDSGLASLAKNLSTLTSLNLAHVGLRDAKEPQERKTLTADGVHQLAALRSLRSLDVIGIRLAVGDPFQAVCTLTQLSSLSIDAAQSQYSWDYRQENEIGYDVSPLAKLVHLRQLRCCNIRAEGLAIVARLAELRSLALPAGKFDSCKQLTKLTNLEVWAQVAGRAGVRLLLEIALLERAMRHVSQLHDS